MAFVEVFRRGTEGGDRVTDLIHRALAENRKSGPMLHEDWIRVSSIGSMCPREEVLCSKNNVIRERSFDGDAGLNFGLGNAIHWLFQNRALAPTGRLIGSWRCTWCGETYGSQATQLVPRPDRCIRCGAIAGEAPRSGGRPSVEIHPLAFLYVEEFVGNEEYRIGGHPDGFMSSSEEPILLEFKSANDRNFFKYKDTPDFVHVIQSQIYLWLTGLKRAKIIYLNKNGSKDNFLREHDLLYDAEVVERVQAAVRSVRDGIGGGLVPARTVCADPSCQRAIGCKVRDICFRESQ